MKAPLSWLYDYVNFDASPAELAHRLTLAGVESEGFEVVGQNWNNVVVGLVKTIAPHPNADRLRLVSVDTGSDVEQVVCGAPNVAVAQKIAFAKIGANLIDAHSGQPATLKQAKIRGVESRGMVCSQRELGLSDEHQGILVLPNDAPLGQPLADYMGDVIFDFAITPNRPDLLSMLGIAREIGALTGQEVREPDLAYVENGEPVSSKTSVEIADPDLCPRYIGAVISGVTIGPSPSWLQARLASYGSRSINNVVDVTNFVMLEMGQPLHAFDYDRLSENRIVVRRSRAGERITTIDAQEHKLDSEMLVIADAQRPIALAGVMGSANSEVSEATVNVLLESANFNRTSIRRTSKKTGLRTEASIRFDKGLNPELPLYAAQRALKLIKEVAGGSIATGVVDVFPGESQRVPILLTESRTSRVLGAEVSSDEASELLSKLGFTPKEHGDGALEVTPPYWRTDISLEEDLIEELVRTKGFDWVPTMSLSGRVPQFEPQPMIALKQVLRDELRSLGLTEVINYSLTNPNYLSAHGLPEYLTEAETSVEDSAALRVANPLSSEQSELRRSLRYGVLQSLASNMNHHQDTLRLFELGRIYLSRTGNLPDEREHLAGAITGIRRDPHLMDPEPGNVDFYDMKGILDALLAKLDIFVTYEPANDRLLHPGRTARLCVGDKAIGVVGEVHPKSLAAFNLGVNPSIYFEIDLAYLLESMPGQPRQARTIPRFPGAVRDLALVLDESLPAGTVQSILEATALVAEARLFDVYTGGNIDTGKKSLAYRIVWQSPGRTLTNEEVDKAQNRLLLRLAKELGATLRD